ncbi:unnamed protein product [Lepidochelys kempii]
MPWDRFLACLCTCQRLCEFRGSEGHAAPSRIQACVAAIQNTEYPVFLYGIVVAMLGPGYERDKMGEVISSSGPTSVGEGDKHSRSTEPNINIRWYGHTVRKSSSALGH